MENLKLVSLENELEDQNPVQLLRALDHVLAFVEIDLNGNIQQVSSKFQTLMGFTQQDIIGRNYLSLLDEKTINSKEFKSLWADVLSGKPGKIRFYKLDNLKRGLWVQADFWPKFDDQNNLIGVVQSSIDISVQVFLELEVLKVK